MKTAKTIVPNRINFKNNIYRKNIFKNNIIFRFFMLILSHQFQELRKLEIVENALKSSANPKRIISHSISLIFSCFLSLHLTFFLFNNGVLKKCSLVLFTSRSFYPFTIVEKGCSLVPDQLIQGCSSPHSSTVTF